ncbi:hypothetical protein [Celeribacter marinus]|uniref:hypothetical protein n=1 Tax=Celeribacter marinus TaxID=1397108 RepID=UPI003F6A6A33
MAWMIWVGALLTLFGLALLVYCIVAALKAKKLGGTDEEVLARLQKVVPLNMLALMTSALGLGAVTIGIILT